MNKKKSLSFFSTEINGLWIKKYIKKPKYKKPSEYVMAFFNDDKCLSSRQKKSSKSQHNINYWNVCRTQNE